MGRCTSGGCTETDPQTGWVGARLGAAAADATACAAGLRLGTQQLSAGAWTATCHTDPALLSRPGLRTTPPRPDTLLSSRPISFRLLKEPSATTPHRVSHRLVPTSSRQARSLPQRSTPPALQQGSLHSTESGRQVIHCRARPRFLLGTLDSRFLSSCLFPICKGSGRFACLSVSRGTGPNQKKCTSL